MPNWTEEIKTTISWEDEDKSESVTITRARTEDFTRAKLATIIKGDPTATITRKDIEDYFKEKPTIDWSEESESTIDWIEETK